MDTNSVIDRLKPYEEYMSRTDMLGCSLLLADELFRRLFRGGYRFRDRHIVNKRLLTDCKAKFENKEFCSEDGVGEYYSKFMRNFGKAVDGMPVIYVTAVLEGLPHPFDVLIPSVPDEDKKLTKSFLYGTREFRALKGRYTRNIRPELSEYRKSLYTSFMLSRRGRPIILRNKDIEYFDGLTDLERELIEYRNMHFGQSPEAWEPFIAALTANGSSDRDTKVAAIKRLRGYELENGINWSWPYAKFSREKTRKLMKIGR